jgi:hypothetical protein
VSLSHRRSATGQRIWFAFADVRHHWWQHWLRPGFRHCFAAIEEAGSWTVVEPLSGQLIVTRLELPIGFDLPGVYRRAGLTVSGPHQPGSPRMTFGFSTLNCVTVAKSLLGDAAPRGRTPYQMYVSLENHLEARKKSLTPAGHRV